MKSNVQRKWSPHLTTNANQFQTGCMAVSGSYSFPGGSTSKDEIRRQQSALFRNPRPFRKMPLTKDELLNQLTSQGIQFSVQEHQAVMTVEAQAKELACLPGSPAKNLFLKDKKNRLYIICALPSTKIDLKVLSARLGLGKGGVSMAAAELIDVVLKVPQGSVTPLAVANPEAANVALLLDCKLQSQEMIFVHPLVNTVSIGLSPSALSSALRALGREPVYVDLEAEPKIDRDNPPDLAQHVPAAAAVEPAPAPAGAAQQAAPAPAAAASKAAATPAAAAPKRSKDSSSKAAKEGPVSSAAVHQQLTNVAACTEDLLQKVATALLGTNLQEVKADPYVVARLRADIEMQLTGLKNAAYTTGYMAGKGEVVAHAEKRYV